jgi:5-methylcytosine-specific restriction endonuclease McrA
MSYKDRDINRKKARRSGQRQAVISGDIDTLINREKSRARELRGSSWWKAKISAGKCYYCGGRFKPSDLTMDHKIPLSRGGTSEKNNIVPACKECNNRKKYMLPSEWEEYLDKIKNTVI